MRVNIGLEKLRLKSETIDRITKIADSRAFDLRYLLFTGFAEFIFWLELMSDGNLS